VYAGTFGATVTAYRLTGKGLVLIKLVRNSRFGDFATDWEKAWSVLLVDKSKQAFALNPVVNMNGVLNGVVVGHHGWVNGENILVPEASQEGRLRDLLLDGTPVFIRAPAGGRDKPVSINKTTFVRPFTTEERYQLLTDVDGRALILTGRDVVGLQSADEIVWTLVGVGSLLLALGKAGGWRLITSLVARTVRSKASQVVGRMTVEDMERYLIGIMKRRPELGRMYGITVRNLNGEALRDEVLAVLRSWEQSYGRNVQFVEEGAVQGLTAPGNVMSLQGDRLMIERQLLGDPRRLFAETAHELAADALGVRGQNITAAQLAFIGDHFTQINNALYILDQSLQNIGGLRALLNVFRGL
jgi:hypothetical protein